MRKIFLTMGLVFLSTLPISVSSHAAEICRIIFDHSGNADSVCKDSNVLLSRKLKGSQSFSEALCQNDLSFMKDDASFEQWKTKPDKKGNITWDNRWFLDNVSKELDDNGNFKALAGKSITLCFKGCDNFTCPWRNMGSIQIPASPQGDCGAGMEFVNGSCQDGTVVGDGDPTDVLGVVALGYSAIVAGEEHNSGSEVPDTAGALAGGGLLAEEAPSGSENLTNGLGGLLSNGLSNLGNMLGLSSPSNGGAGSLSGSGSGGSDSQTPGMVTYGLTGSADGANSGEGKYAQAGGGMGSNSKFSGSAIGSTDGVGLANSDNSNQQAQYGADRKIASLGSGDGSGANGSGDDAADYFARIGLGDDIFKVVEKKYREKQTGWIVLNKAKK